MPRKRRILYFVTEDWYFCSHRLPLAIAAKEAGFEVSVVTRVRSHGDQIKKSGINLIPLELSRRSINPLNELGVINRLISIYRTVKPDIVHHVALKPVLYGTIASTLTNVPHVINALAGLGILFSSKSYKVRILRPFIKIVFRILLNRKNYRMILQNPDDMKLMCDMRIVNKERIALICGSGVDTKMFSSQPERPGQINVLLASRLLWDKGVREFVIAAEHLERLGVNARFIIAGKGDPENPTSIPDSQLRDWHNKGVIDWLGHRNDMPALLAQSHIICLPSYYGEGVPKILIEAAACGRAIITTDTPGCREIVRNGENGLLVPIKDSPKLADAIKKLIEDDHLRQKMGKRGRQIVENEFSLEKINTETLSLYYQILQ